MPGKFGMTSFGTILTFRKTDLCDGNEVKTKTNFQNQEANELASIFFAYLQQC